MIRQIDGLLQQRALNVIAPEAGTVRILGRAMKEYYRRNEGVPLRVRILRGEAQVWPERDWAVVPVGDLAGASHDVTLAVARGDAIRFVLDKAAKPESAVLAWMLFAAYHARSPWMSQIALALAILGAIFCIVGSVLVIYGFTGFVLAGWYTGVGNALIGLWLAAFCYSMQPGEALPRNLLMLGLIAGAFMAFGLIGIPGTFSRVDGMEAMPWFLYFAYFGYLGTYILYPIWTIWLGRTLLLR